MIEGIFNFVASWLVEVLLTVVFYWPGWLVLRLVTVGRYPPRLEQPHNVVFVSTIGFAALLAALTIGYQLSGS
ncbi:hypothetical protein [Niveibacterium umoris]|uniref:Uncharacterized protein n=1 Tax=Niveibacterium umoris TaxID=1193620 RepID=A0A840BQP6_9RHOO|nr:hypothetical protein [Niveibacterium umoris]MBB4014942.1 hypothetical protein [Niveibacterium umoris]MBB4014943.1 hypothetical protein [Niveibacterium umoris]